MANAQRIVLKKSTTKSPQSETAREQIRLGFLLAEKCELMAAHAAFSSGLKTAKRASDQSAAIEALSGLLRLAGEALNDDDLQKVENELDPLLSSLPVSEVPALAWYCKGAIARQRQPRSRVAQRYFLLYLRESRRNGDSIGVARAWSMLVTVLLNRRMNARAAFAARCALSRFSEADVKGVNGTLYLIQGEIAENKKNFTAAMAWYQKAYAAFLSEHNWYLHLYVLCFFARIARLQQNFSLASWHLDLVDRAAAGDEYGRLRQLVDDERRRMNEDSVDLVIDSRQGVIRTREQTRISLRKQYVLMSILEALSQAHDQDDIESRGLSKAEIIERVWHERYKPEMHDNKLYYNINRLRKLIEPDMRQPQYLLNWKEGYRLAPGLRVQTVTAGGDRNQLRRDSASLDRFI